MYEIKIRTEIFHISLSVMKIAHILNPFNASKGSEHHVAQQITYESMLHARNYAKGSTELSIELHASCFEEDVTSVPDFFDKTSILQRSVSDINSSCTAKKLPLLKDILDHGFSDESVDYVIYTNVDISVLPYFYTCLADIAATGIDAAVINRRRIDESYLRSESTNLRYADSGLYHSGNDCFLIHRSVYEKMNLADVCIGIPHVGNTLFYNLLAHSANFKLFGNLHLTQHIGYDLVRNWGNHQYLNHNKLLFKSAAKQLTPAIDIAKFPGSHRWFCSRHFRWLMNPTIHYPSIFKHDIKHLFKKRINPKKPGMSGFWGRYYERLQDKVRLD